MTDVVFAPVVEEPEFGMNATELTPVVARIEERLTLYVKLFLGACSGVVVAAGVIGTVLWGMHGSIARLEQGQANAASNIVSGLLKRVPSDTTEAAQNLAAAATLLRVSRIGEIKPTVSAIQSVSAELVRAQSRYQDLPELWQATARFINYRSVALLPPKSEQVLSSAKKVFNCKNIVINMGQVVLKECTLDLDAIKAPNAVFVNCVIRYRGGPVEIRRMEFVNCLFDFDIKTVPPRNMRMAMMMLTTENSTSGTADFGV